MTRELLWTIGAIAGILELLLTIWILIDVDRILHPSRTTRRKKR